MTRHGRPHRQGIVAVIVFGAFASGLWAAETTTSSLVVNGDSEFRGDLNVTDASTGSAPTNGLVLYYSFSTNTTPVADNSGNGHTGTVSGATWVTNGQSEGAYSFDGTGDYITVTGYKGVTGNIPVSVSLWFRTSSSLTNWPILYFWGNDLVARKANHLSYNVNNGAWYFAVAGNGLCVYSLSRLNDDTWHHMTTICDGRYMKLYVDSVLQGSTDTTTGLDVAVNQDVKIGIYKDSSSQCFYGTIDEFRIYSRALSSNEVEGLYLYDAHLKAGTARFETGVSFVKPLGDLSMGAFTNAP